MNNRKLAVLAVVGILFCFAGYNLWSYFKEQQIIQAEEDRLTTERRAAKEAARQEREARAKADREEREVERAAEKVAEETRQKEEAEKREQARILEEARLEVEDAARIELEKKHQEERLQHLLEKARQVTSYEGIWYDKIEGLLELSPRYVLDHPEEFKDRIFSAVTFGAQERKSIKVFFEDSNSLMLYAAISQDLKLLQAFLDIGIDVNSANKGGVTPLMFAATYSSPEVVTFLIENGADISAISYIEDMNALHFASRHNPIPATTSALVSAGLPIESKTSKDETPALLAALHNRNMEIVEQLALAGADIEAYHKSGVDVRAITKTRFTGTFKNSVPFYPINPEYQEQVLRALEK